jgi:hypothetical protein
MEFPKELQDKIVEMSLVDEEYNQVVEDMKRFVPTIDNSANHPFFCPGPAVPKSVSRVRSSSLRLPPIMKRLYENYPPDVEFSAPTVTFFSERNMKGYGEDSDLIDIGYRYVGMGHIVVYTYDSETDNMISHLDGGANGFDRMENGTSRLKMLSEYASSSPRPKNIGTPFFKWWDSDVRVL